MVTKTLYRAILHYYVALTMSAGSVAPLPWTLSLDGPAPIVRKYIHRGSEKWDPREAVNVDNGFAILTSPLSLNGTSRKSIVLKN